jgi:hypothetical protein
VSGSNTLSPRSIRGLSFENCIRILRVSHALGHELYYNESKEYLIEQVKKPKSADHFGVIHPPVLYHFATVYDIAELLLPSIRLQLSYSSPHLDPPPIIGFADDRSFDHFALLSRYLSAVSSLAVLHLLNGTPHHELLASPECNQQNTGCSFMAQESIWQVGRLSVRVMDDYNGDIHDLLTKLSTVVWRKFDVCEPCEAKWAAEIQKSMGKLEGMIRKWTKTLPQSALLNEELEWRGEKHASLIVNNLVLLS